MGEQGFRPNSVDVVRLATASLASWRERGDLKLTDKP